MLAKISILVYDYPTHVLLTSKIHSVDGLMTVIMDGGHYNRGRVANRLRVLLPGR